MKLPPESLNYRGKMREFQTMLPCNCDQGLGVKEKCPYCGQFHLRPGFCQAIHNPALRIDKSVTVTAENVTSDKIVTSKRDIPLPSKKQPMTAAQRQAKSRAKKRK